MGFQRGDEVAAATDLGGFWKGQIPAGTPGVVDNVESRESAAPLYTVTFVIEHDDLLVPHHATVTQLSDGQLTHG
jgi:hypothetical protein